MQRKTRMFLLSLGTIIITSSIILANSFPKENASHKKEHSTKIRIHNHSAAIIERRVYIKDNETGLCFMWATIVTRKGHHLTTHNGSFGLVNIPCKNLPKGHKK